MHGHCRNRSLIPVSDLKKFEKLEKAHLSIDAKEHGSEEEAAEENLSTAQAQRQNRTINLVYLLFLAEALSAASFAGLLRSRTLAGEDTACSSKDAIITRQLLTAAYALGATLGVVCGWTADRYGRRKTALPGLIASCVCSTILPLCHYSIALLGCLAVLGGAAGAAATVAGLTMLADLTHRSKRRVAIIAKLPLVAAGAGLLSIAAYFVEYILLLCAIGNTRPYREITAYVLTVSILFGITITEFLYLKETLDSDVSVHRGHGKDAHDEKFGLMHANAFDSTESFETRSSDSTRERLRRRSSLSISQTVQAPAIALLLASYSILSVHSSTFDVMLPFLAHITAQNDGSSSSCNITGFLGSVISLLTGIYIATCVPRIIKKFEILGLYRYISIWLPALYIILPFLIAGAVAATPSVSAMAIITGLSSLIKAMLTDSAKTLVLLLVLLAAPDARSTGTIVGSIYVSRFFEALTKGLCALGYLVLDGRTLPVLNGALRLALVAIAVVGVGLAYKLRERPCVGADIPEECLVWEDLFDTESDGGSS